jgi:TPP-dependent pyruvate/acetoin dehydrogenase alpha subunit
MVRNNPSLKKHLRNNVTGNEVAFGSIGDASTSEGIFWETVNAAGIMQVPLAIAVYDDGYGISVPVELQTTKSSISKVLQGFQKEKNTNGIDIYTCNGWDYPALIKTFSEGIARCRETQVPAVFHITEVTQPLGHSTSGSHERYKTSERLSWEKEFDGIIQMKKWLLESGMADIEMLDELEKEAGKQAKKARDNAWSAFLNGYKKEQDELKKILQKIENKITMQSYRLTDFEKITRKTFPTRRSHLSFAKGLSLKIHLNKKWQTSGLN